MSEREVRCGKDILYYTQVCYKHTTHAKHIRRVLTQFREFERISGVDDVDERLQFEATRRRVYVVVEHSEFECGLNFLGALFEYRTWIET